jgi:hypothetical protein
MKVFAAPRERERASGGGEREREWEWEKQRGRERERGWEREMERERDRDMEREREREREKEKERERERKRNRESGGVRGGDAGGYRRDDKGRKHGGRDSHGENFRVPKLNIDINKQIMGARGASELCSLVEARAAEFNHVNIATAFRTLLQGRCDGGPRGVVERALQELEAAALRTIETFNAQEVPPIKGLLSSYNRFHFLL